MIRGNRRSIRVYSHVSLKSPFLSVAPFDLFDVPPCVNSTTGIYSTQFKTLRSVYR